MSSTSPLRRAGLAVAAVTSLVPGLVAQVRVADLATTSSVGSSSPRDFVGLSSNTLFLTTGTGPGRLWSSDGTSAGTRALFRTNESPVSVLGPAFVAGANVGLFLFGRRDTNGFGLFRTDGSTGGTYELSAGDGVRPSSATLPVLHQSVFYFAARRADSGEELWRSDGTPSGTALVADLNPGTASSSPRMLSPTPLGLFFVARDAGNVDRLWLSDGTGAGTAIVPGISYPQALAGTTSGAVFTMYAAATGRELHFSDGTANGPVLLADATPGTVGSIVYDRGISLGARAVFYLSTPSDGFEPWVSDGSPAGTFRLRDIAPGAASSLPSSSLPYLTRSGNRVWFVADDGSHGAEPWVSDGTSNGTQLVADIVPGSAGSDPQAFGPTPSGAVFRATTVAAGTEPWISDGSAGGTRLLADVVPGPNGSSPDQLFGVGTRYWFSATTSAAGAEPWVSDGTAPGTRLLADLGVAIADSNPAEFVAAGARTVFVANDGTGLEAFGSDGTAAGTQKLDLGTGSASPAELTSFQNFAWFIGTSPTHGREIFRTDGTPAGTSVFIDFVPGPAGSSPRNLSVVGSRLFFGAGVTGFGVEPHISDGTVAGTLRLADLAVGFLNSNPGPFVAAGPSVLFFADDGSPGLEIFKTDGTVNGTGLAVDIDSLNGGISGAELRSFGTAAAFIARNHSVWGTEVWRTDGTFPGTWVLADLNPGVGGSDPSDLVVTGDNRLFFIADSGFGRELHVSDGTTAGTRMVVDLVANGSAPITRLTAGPNRVWFAMTDARGTELWTSDGTAVGTRVLREIAVGEGSGLGSAGFASLPGNSGIAFAGSHPVDLLQIWVSDGSFFGTHPVGRFLTPLGPGAARIANLRVVNGAVWFAGDDTVTGLEPWSASLDVRRAYSSTFGVGCAGSSGVAPTVDAPLQPRLGEAGFRIDLVGALPFAGCVTLVGFAGLPPAVGCGLLVAPPAIAGPTLLSSGAGIASLPLGIPNLPSIAGAELFAQWAVIDPAGSFLPGIVLSDGLQFRIGLP
ncbi:MAG: hypothetical protein IT457_25165 [Planctomycetes bacterium]|nr:hypothetical protein [Planctomycetota bacterium]